MAKNTAVPISDCFVETESSLGTGMKEKISTFFKILMQKFEDYYYLMKESVTLSYEFLYIKDININKISNKNRK